MQEQLSTQTARNEEIQNSLENNSGVAEYAERKARSELDYAKPGERVFVDVGAAADAFRRTFYLHPAQPRRNLLYYAA